MTSFQPQREVRGHFRQRPLPHSRLNHLHKKLGNPNTCLWSEGAGRQKDKWIEPLHRAPELSLWLRLLPLGQQEALQASCCVRLLLEPRSPKTALCPRAKLWGCQLGILPGVEGFMPPLTAPSSQPPPQLGPFL